MWRVLIDGELNRLAAAFGNGHDRTVRDAENVIDLPIVNCDVRRVGDIRSECGGHPHYLGRYHDGAVRAADVRALRAGCEPLYVAAVAKGRIPPGARLPAG
jgi:hypothetical protein